MENLYVEALGPSHCDIVQRRRGGFGDVLILSQNGEQPSHVVKLIRSKNEAENGMISEVSSLANLVPHPNVVEIEAYSKTELGHGMLMPYYAATLRDLMQMKIPPDQAQVLSIASQIADGLLHLHKQNVLHLDLKPENVLMANDGTPVLTDFGLARLVDRPAPEQNAGLQIAVSGMDGTLQYMAPEQFISTLVSVKTDIFSFGVMLFELVTGRLPFSGNSVRDYAREVIRSAVRFSGPEKRRIPRWLQELISLMLAKSPKMRPPAIEVCQAMRTRQSKSSPALDTEHRAVRDINRAGALASMGDMGKALSMLEGITRKFPWNLSARTNVAEIYFQLGQVDQAIEAASLAHSLLTWFPEQVTSEPVICLNLSLYLMTRNPNAAYEITRKAVQRYPDNWELLHNHAEACRLASVQCPEKQTALLEEGIRSAQKALASGPNDENLRITYAGLLRQSGRREMLVPYLNQLMKDVGEHSIPAWILYLNANLDDGMLDYVEMRVKELSKHQSFQGLLTGIERRLESLRKAQQ